MKKKILVVPFLLLLALAGCQPKGYNIVGEVKEGDFDSVQVVLCERINRVWHNLDSTVIVNGKFELKGAVDSVRIMNLFFKGQDTETNRMEPFIFENGTIFVKVDSARISVTGTKQNDAFDIYKKERQAYIDDIDAEYERFMKLPDSLKTQEKEEAADSVITAVLNKMTEKNVDYSMRTVNTILGNYIFTSSFYDFTIEQKEALFAKMSEETKSIPRIAELIAATEVAKKTSVGQPYIDIEAATPQDGTLKLSDLVGKTDYLLVDFWASWCGPCIRTFPELTAFYQQYKGDKFEILGVSLDSEKQSWLDAIAKHKLAWPHISDLKYWDSQGAKLYAVNSIPSTVLIDKEGKIVGRNMKLNEIENLLNP